MKLAGTGQFERQAYFLRSLIFLPYVPVYHRISCICYQFVIHSFVHLFRLSIPCFEQKCIYFVCSFFPVGIQCRPNLRLAESLLVMRQLSIFLYCSQKWVFDLASWLDLLSFQHAFRLFYVHLRFSSSQLLYYDQKIVRARIDMVKCMQRKLRPSCENIDVRMHFRRILQMYHFEFIVVLWLCIVSGMKFEYCSEREANSK